MTSWLGTLFGLLLIGLGIWAVAMGSYVSGLWLALIGLFLRAAAWMSYQQMLVRGVLKGEPVSRFMNPEPVTVPRHISLLELVETYADDTYDRMFPVTDGLRLVGLVRLRQVGRIPRDEWVRQAKELSDAGK